MIDAIDELVERSRDCKELQEFHAFHRRHPEVLDFLVEEIQLRRKMGKQNVSYGSLWSYAEERWQQRLKTTGTTGWTTT